MQTKHFFLALMLSLPAVSWAQGSLSGYKRYTEAGPWIGLANYSGDVAEDRIVFGETKVGFGFVVRHHFARHLALRVHVQRGNISGKDQNSKDQSLKDRNFSFFTPLTELGGAVEYHFIDRDRVTGTGVFTNSISPYIFAGGAVAFIHPEVECERLGSNDCPTFPEPEQKTRRVAFPVGLGVRTDLVEQVSLAIEVGWRPTFADDLDGVSLNGNKKANDWYIFFGGTLSYIFGDPYSRK